MCASPTAPSIPLTAIPTTLDAYSGIATQVAIDGGQPPYRAFSSNTAVLPVADPVANIVGFIPGNVTANTPVTITIRDAVGASVNVNVTVHPAPTTPPPALAVLPSTLNVFSGVATSLAPYPAARSTSPRACLQFASVSAVEVICTTAARNISGASLWRRMKEEG